LFEGKGVEDFEGIVKDVKATAGLSGSGMKMAD
jgi:hypothetical protein